MRILTVIVLSLIAASSAYAQIDAFSLRSKYGLPLDRETFTVRPGIEIRVDYGPAKQACGIVMPMGITFVGEPSPDIITREQMKEVLDEVVPASVRGKEIRRGSMSAGIQHVVYTEYEHVTIQERFNSSQIVVVFEDPACRME
jgi:hypothetical protein